VSVDLWDDLSGTWIGDLVRFATAHVPSLALAVVGLVILTSGLWALRLVARGGGQYGIIEGYVGMIGAGKTTLAVQHAMTLARARGAVLLSNIPVVCGPLCPRQHVIEHALLPVTDDGIDLTTLTRTAFRLRDEERGLVLLMDEVGVVMPARLWRDMSVALMWVLQQSRKLACEWIWTAQDASFVDHQLRTLTAVVWHVRALPPPSIWRRAKGKRPWWLVASAYVPQSAPRANFNVDDGARSRDRRIGRRFFRYRRSWELAFDTDAVVLPSRHMKGASEILPAMSPSFSVGGNVLLGTSGASSGPLTRRLLAARGVPPLGSGEGGPPAIGRGQPARAQGSATGL